MSQLHQIQALNLWLNDQIIGQEHLIERLLIALVLQAHPVQLQSVERHSKEYQTLRA